jgi:DNA-binding LacI/PurR family transcriptional regulator
MERALKSMAEGNGGARNLTLTELARRAGVSLSTASNAYNRPDQLSSELRERILAMADEIGYLGPDPAARAMARGRYDAVGLVMSGRFSHAFHSAAAIELLRGVATACERAETALTLLPMHSESDESQLIPKAAVDAIGLFAIMDGAPIVDQVLRRGLPIVTADQPRLEGIPFVGLDEVAAARRAAEHIVTLGHRQIGILSLPALPDQTGGIVVSTDPADIRYRVTRDRLRGYLGVLAEHDLPEPIIMACARSEVGAGQAAASAILASAAAPTALLCMSDEIAIGAELAAQSFGIAIPDQLSIIGFDNFPGTPPAPVPLTTISQNAYERGLLLGAWLIRPPERPQAHILGTDLIVRDSTGLAPESDATP